MNRFEKKRMSTLQKAQSVVEERGGTVLDANFEKSHSKILVRCGAGHTWYASPYRLNEGVWCFSCARSEAAKTKRSTTFLRFREHLHAIGATTTAITYEFGGQKLPIVCVRGHEYTVDPVDVLYRGADCRQCRKEERVNKANLADEARATVANQAIFDRHERLRSAAEEQGGIFLTSLMVDGKSYARLRCVIHGTESLVRNDRIISGQWCKLCGIEGRAVARRQKTYLKAQEVAKQKGGRVLSSGYPLGARVLEWECAHGHRWSATPASIISGRTWCPLDADRSPKTMSVSERQVRAVASRLQNCLLVARERASGRGGECLTKEYRKSQDGLLFRCQRGHEFRMRFRDTSHHWCPTCAKTRSSRGENLSREILEQLLGFSLKTARPGWLRSSKGRGLSLDMYNADHSLAFEYQGVGVHSQFRISSWYSNPDKFDRTVELDREKQEACRRQGVLLISIPGFRDYVSLDDIIGSLKELLRLNGVEFNENAEVRVDHNALFGDDLHDRVSAVVAAKGGVLKTPVIPGMLHAIDVRCVRHQNTWSTSASRLIHRGGWCPECAVERRRGPRRVRIDPQLGTEADGSEPM